MCFCNAMLTCNDCDWFELRGVVRFVSALRTNPRVSRAYKISFTNYPLFTSLYNIFPYIEECITSLTVPMGIGHIIIATRTGQLCSSAPIIEAMHIAPSGIEVRTKGRNTWIHAVYLVFVCSYWKTVIDRSLWNLTGIDFMHPNGNPTTSSSCAIPERFAWEEIVAAIASFGGLPKRQDLRVWCGSVWVFN